MDVRGFYVKSAEAREQLETVGRSFLAGYGHAAESAQPLDAEAALERVPMSFRGFAYEGAAMAFAVRDGLPLGRRDHVAGFLQGRADRHIYMVYVGVGWAMARLPRFRWSTLTAPDPLLRWLVLDGYGFHQAYFQTRRYVWEQHEDPRFPWPGPALSDYAARVIDQGIGRATWFVGGGDPDVVAHLFGRFPEHRRPDLFSGAGLAATYAGAATQEELERFWELAGDYRPQVAQGAAFAAGARVRADVAMPHNELATQVFCAMSVAEAAKVTDEALVDLPTSGTVPVYEVWRRRIQDACGPRGDC
jgi:hypothetical protein